MPASRCDARDLDLVAALASGALPPDAFDHAAHLRLGYAVLVDVDGDVDAASARIQALLRTYLVHHGIDPARVSITLTRAWVLAVALFMRRHPETRSGAAFLERARVLRDPSVMLTHYSRERLFSERARTTFVAPDLDPIPLA